MYNGTWMDQECIFVAKYVTQFLHTILTHNISLTSDQIGHLAMGALILVILPSMLLICGCLLDSAIFTTHKVETLWPHPVTHMGKPQLQLSYCMHLSKLA